MTWSTGAGSVWVTPSVVSRTGPFGVGAGLGAPPWAGGVVVWPPPDPVGACWGAVIEGGVEPGPGAWPPGADSPGAAGPPEAGPAAAPPPPEAAAGAPAPTGAAVSVSVLEPVARLAASPAGSSGPEAIWPSEPSPPSPPDASTAASARIASGAATDTPTAPAACRSHVPAMVTGPW